MSAGGARSLEHAPIHPAFDRRDADAERMSDLFRGEVLFQHAVISMFVQSVRFILAAKREPRWGKEASLWFFHEELHPNAADPRTRY